MAAPRRTHAFSVLAHDAVIDTCWDDTIVPTLRQRFPQVRSDELERAHAHAYGGAQLADLGYFPLGSHLFSDLVHYVRVGDFVAALIQEARSVDEYAFALGALSHYVTDETGHPEVTNPTVAELYPELQRKYGDSVTYAQDRSAHLQTEFRFDVLQLARSRQTPDLYRHAVAFEVPQAALDRAFVATYGLHLDDIFVSTDVAIATYRWAFRSVVEEATGIAWQLYRSEIEALDPAATAKTFVAHLSRADFEKEFGKTYREAGYFTRFVAFLVKAIPNVGPFKRLPYKALPSDARERFAAGVDHAVARYRAEVGRLRMHRPSLRDVNLDTGGPTRAGTYPPADDAYTGLLEKLDQRGFADVSPLLRADILRFYAEGAAAHAGSGDDERERVADALARLETRSTR